MLATFETSGSTTGVHDSFRNRHYMRFRPKENKKRVHAEEVELPKRKCADFRILAVALDTNMIEATFNCSMVLYGWGPSSSR